MENTRKLAYYTIDIYNDHHSCDGLLEVDESGKIVACEDLNTCDGWREYLDGETDTILDMAMDEANKAIEAGEVPLELPISRGDYLVIASVEYDGNCADVLAHYADEDDED